MCKWVCWICVASRSSHNFFSAEEQCWKNECLPGISSYYHTVQRAGARQFLCFYRYTISWVGFYSMVWCNDKLEREASNEVWSLSKVYRVHVQRESKSCNWYINETLLKSQLIIIVIKGALVFKYNVIFMLIHASVMWEAPLYMNFKREGVESIGER